MIEIVGDLMCIIIQSREGTEVTLAFRRIPLKNESYNYYQLLSMTYIT